MDADGDLPEGVPAEELGNRENRPGALFFVNTRESAPREFYITQKDVQKHGYTRGCAGCSSFTRGLGRQPHSDERRERFRKAMCEDAKVKNSEVRRKEFEERQNEKKRKKEDKKEQSDLKRDQRDAKRSWKEYDQEHKEQKKKRKGERDGDQEMEGREVVES